MFRYASDIYVRAAMGAKIRLDLQRQLFARSERVKGTSPTQMSLIATDIFSQALTSTPSSHGFSPPSTAATSTSGPTNRNPSSRPSSSPMSLYEPAASLPARTGSSAAAMTFNYESTTTTPPRRSPPSKHIQTTSARLLSTPRVHSSSPPQMT